MAFWLTCSVVRGILVPQQGIKPMSPALEGRFLTTGPPVKSLWGKHSFFFFLWGKGSILKDKVRERSCRVCDQLVHSSLTG